MGSSEVEIVISPDGGEVKVDGKNFVGGACKTAIDKITKGLGEEVEGKKKPEFYQQEQNQLKQY